MSLTQRRTHGHRAPTLTRGLPVLAAMCLIGLGAPTEEAQAQTGWQVYTGREQPTKNDKPPGGPWTPAGADGSVDVPYVDHNEYFYVAVENIHVPGWDKTLTLTITGPGAHDVRAGLATVPGGYGRGYYDDANGNTRSSTCDWASAPKMGDDPESVTIKFHYPKQPDWEFVRLYNNGDYQSFDLKIVADSECSYTGQYGFRCESEGGFGGPDTLGDMRITEMGVFPRSVPIDPNDPMTFIAPHGNWLHGIVFTDPTGEPRPLGGAHFMADDLGLAPAEVYSFGFGMLGVADTSYDFYAFDADSGRWIEYDWTDKVLPAIGAWDTVRAHGGVGPLGLEVDPVAIDDGEFEDADPIGEMDAIPVVESREGGIERLELALNHPAVALDPTVILVTDGVFDYMPTGAQLIDGGFTLAMDFAPGTLPGDRAYLVDVGDAVPDLVRDSDTLVIAMTADVNGDGKVNEDDALELDLHLGQPAGPENARYDLDLDGVITAADSTIVLARMGASIWCEDALVHIPWVERFDGYDAGTTAHGQGGWFGWEDDPTFDTPFTTDESRSGAQAIDVTGAADMVCELSPQCDSGRWAFTAWQYIPSSFQSGGGPLPGTHFILLNEYLPPDNDAWSVEMQFDSIDGMLKVYHGNDMNTVDVPYDTDRWVEIQIVIDLDVDWTQVYYDDALITEYSWTGGVLGGGSGELDIAAVDLVANGSSSVYYDDLKLERLPGPAPCTGDLDGNGEIEVDDLLALLGAWGTGDGDVNGDGTTDVVDLLILLGNWGECP